MLTPRDRRLLLEALKPPAGYRFDRAIGTSFTLDLMALMTAPLAFTFFDWEDGEGRPSSDPVALLEALRRHADRIFLFCQTGRIQVPPAHQRLLLYLDESVIEVAAPQKGGIFHPKVWLLRYTSADEPVHYRFLCLSRNLTFDRSWDTALVLDGLLEDRKNAFAANHPLGDFIASLPELAVRQGPEPARRAAELLSDEVRRVRFELPERFEDYAFWPLGLERRRRRAPLPFPKARRGRRMLVVSPFLADGLLERLAMDRPAGALVSRPESLQALRAETLEHFDEVFVLADEADPEEAEQEAAEERERVERLTGLHAKLFVLDDGHKGRVWTGSANATDAAFERNVEFLVELTATKSVCGIESMLGEDAGKGTRFRDLLMPFSRDETLLPEAEPGAAERALDELRIQLGQSRLRAVVDGAAEGNEFSLEVLGGRSGQRWPDQIEIRCHPVTLAPSWSRELELGSKPLARFTRLPLDALTGFFAFEMKLRHEGQDAVARFVLNLPMEGAPEDRRERLLHAILHDSNQVLRLLWLLLSELDVSVQDWLDAAGAPGGQERRAGDGAGGFPLLEGMLKALDRDPGRLDDVGRLVADLKSTPEGARLLPPGFDEIWTPISRARSRLP